MSNFKKCKECNDHHWTDMDCLPIYKVYHEEYLGDEPKDIRANSHDEAATKYAEYYNADDYALMNEVIVIKVCFDAVCKWFSVGAEPDVHYSSTEIDKPKEDNHER